MLIKLDGDIGIHGGSVVSFDDAGFLAMSRDEFSQHLQIIQQSFDLNNAHRSNILDLRYNSLGFSNEQELPQLIKAASGSSKLDLRHNELSRMHASELSAALGNLPPSIQVLDLRNNGLEKKSGADLVKTFGSIPETVEFLLLDSSIIRFKPELAERLIYSRKRGLYKFEIKALSEVNEYTIAIDKIENAMRIYCADQNSKVFSGYYKKKACLEALADIHKWSVSVLDKRTPEQIYRKLYDELFVPHREHYRKVLAHNDGANSSYLSVLKCFEVDLDDFSSYNILRAEAEQARHARNGGMRP